jgi:hypothetical protein
LQKGKGVCYEKARFFDFTHNGDGICDSADRNSGGEYGASHEPERRLSSRSDYQRVEH